MAKWQGMEESIHRAYIAPSLQVPYAQKECINVVFCGEGPKISFVHCVGCQCDKVVRKLMCMKCRIYEVIFQRA